jgi:acyl-CoA thioesterase FadM
MNNGKYLSILDLARVDLMTRAGVAAIISKQNWYPVIVAETIRFYKSLRLFNSFFVETTVLGWDEKAFILQQRFMKDEVCYALAIIRARFLKKAGGTVEPKEVLEHAGMVSDSPQIVGWIQDWNQQQIK